MAVRVGGGGRGGFGFPDFLKIKIIPRGVHSPPGRHRSTSLHHQSGGAPSLPPQLIPHRPDEPPRGDGSGSGVFVPKQIPQIPEWDLKGEAGFLLFPARQPRWRRAALTSRLALTLRPPLRFQAPPMRIPAAASGPAGPCVALTGPRVCLRASARESGVLRARERRGASRREFPARLNTAPLSGDKLHANVQPSADGDAP